MHMSTRHSIARTVPTESHRTQATSDVSSESLSDHITENIENIAAVQLREQQKLGDSHRRLGWVGDIAGRPGYLLLLSGLVA